MRLKRPIALALVLFAALLGVGYAEDTASIPAPYVGDLLGAWKEKGEKRLVRIERDHLVVHEDGQPRVVRILESGPGSVTVRNLGVKESWSLSRKDGLLLLGRGAELLRYEVL